MALIFFRFIPKLVHFLKAHVFEFTSLLFGALLDVVEAPHELEVGLLEGIVGTNLIESRGIDHGEEQVAEFGLFVASVFFSQLRLQFVEFFVDFCPYIFAVFPIEAYVCHFVLNTILRLSK